MISSGFLFQYLFPVGTCGIVLLLSYHPLPRLPVFNLSMRTTRTSSTSNLFCCCCRRSHDSNERSRSLQLRKNHLIVLSSRRLFFLLAMIPVSDRVTHLRRVARGSGRLRRNEVVAAQGNAVRDGPAIAPGNTRETRLRWSLVAVPSSKGGGLVNRAKEGF